MGRTRRLVVALTVVAAALVIDGARAEAGGASFHMDALSYEPGDRAIGRTGISWAHNPTLGTPEQGPYDVYLVPMASLQSVTEWPLDGSRLPDAVFADVIEITEGPIEEAPGFLVGPHGATIDFIVPDLPDGQYALTNCNRPCTTPLADITGGELWIGPPPPFPPNELGAPGVAPSPVAAEPPPNPITTTTTAPSTTTSTTAPTTTMPSSAPPTTVELRAEEPEEEKEDGAAVAPVGGSSEPFDPFGGASLVAATLIVVLVGSVIVAGRSSLRVVTTPPASTVGNGPEAARGE